MSTFLIYLLKSSVLLGVFDAFFLLVMRRDGHFRFNRFTLLAGSALCLLLPLLQIRTSVPTVYSEWIAPAMVGAAKPVADALSPVSHASGPDWLALLLIAYALGAGVTLGFYVSSYGEMFRMLRHTPGERHPGCVLHLVDRETPSFSWMRHIVINRDDLARYPAILTHERAHVRCGHSCDLVLSSLLSVFQWFNPLVWICRSELKLLHEYEADDFVLNQGIDATQYQLLLVKKAVGEKRFLLANGFNHAQLKNRIIMMQTTKKAAWRKLSVLLLIPLMAGALLLLAECKPAPKEDVSAKEEAVTDNAGSAIEMDEPEAVLFNEVETKPMFQGGDANKFSNWVNEQLNYPEEAIVRELQGRVTLQFTIEKDGSVTGVKVLRGIDPILDNEAARVVSQSPMWTPGYVNGEPVRVVFNFPVLFQLK